tara:strand:+ start:4026 stop:4571 length:546 start_codon:yes stop_codon:yes gene_type:complete
LIYRKGKTKKHADKIINKWTNKWLQNVVKEIKADILNSFDKEAHSDRPQGKWAQLKPSTNKWRRWSGFPEKHPILYNTGKIRNDIEVVYEVDGQEMKVPMGKRNKMKLGVVKVITNNEYSELLNRGQTGYKKGGLQTIKARRHLEIPRKFLNMENRMKLTNFNFYFSSMLDELRAKVYKTR